MRGKAPRAGRPARPLHLGLLPHDGGSPTREEQRVGSPGVSSCSGCSCEGTEGRCTPEACHLRKTRGHGKRRHPPVPCHSGCNGKRLTLGGSAFGKPPSGL